MFFHKTAFILAAYLLLPAIESFAAESDAQKSKTYLDYCPSAPDNPLKGFIPYLTNDAAFPHSMEWDYNKLSDVMTGPNTFEWGKFEDKLNAAASRGHQYVARFYLEWPGKPTGVPLYLINSGLTMHEWRNTSNQPDQPTMDLTPNYEDPELRAALTRFIGELGRRYDGDPRLGFLGLGLLGTWGEWHNYPNEQWFASKTVQNEILDAFETAFKKTKLVTRYPAGKDDGRYAPNHNRAVGYHDDSFAFATVHTGRKSDSWFFETRLRHAEALDKWKTQAIGGEVRPEVWKGLFDEKTSAPPGQEFEACVKATRASWLCNEGVFQRKLNGDERKRALEAARSLGYELHIASVETTVYKGKIAISLDIQNKGVAPFYYDWQVELAALDSNGKIAARWQPKWELTKVLPDVAVPSWTHTLDLDPLAPGTYLLLLRVLNPLKNGIPLRFANHSQDEHIFGYLSLSEFKR